jgi:hypothetical protein
MNRGAKNYTSAQDIDGILASQETPEVTLMRLFRVWQQITLGNIMGTGKLFFELSALYVNDKARLASFLANCPMAQQEADFQMKSLGFIQSQIAEGYFTPVLPLEQIVCYLMASLDGIIRDSILACHYGIGDLIPAAQGWDVDKLVHTACVAFILLLGGNPDLTKEL